jgi:membrane-bound lytic murein transglycosylase B
MKYIVSACRKISLGLFTIAISYSPIVWGSSEKAADVPSKAAPAIAPFDPAKPDTWRASAKLGVGSADREALLRDFCAPSKNSWEKQLTRAEAEAILDDPRAERLYPDKTISIVAPSMLQRQNKGHVDLLERFLKEERIQAGAEFMAANAKLLAEVEARHGVDREVIVSILMWESRLGTITGDFVAFNSFVSQAFFIDEASAVALSQKAERGLITDEKQRARVEKIRSRARRNLVVLVRAAKARGIDPLDIEGSWAGALGFPQFMPASLRWAEDGDGDGKIDLFTFADSIASIANYLKAHGFGPTPELKKKAVWGYNHEGAYVTGVLAFADALKKRGTPPASGSANGKSQREPKPTAAPVP